MECLHWLFLGLSQWTPSPTVQGDSHHSKPAADILQITLQTAGGLLLKGYGTPYGMQGKSTGIKQNIIWYVYWRN